MKIPTLNYQSGMIDIGRFGHAPILLHPSFLIAAVLLTAYFWKAPGGTGPVLVALGGLILFGSILLHELAHAEIGRRRGVVARRVEINIFGGVVHFIVPPHRMRDDFAITIAGPLANVALAIVSLAIVAAVIPAAAPDALHVSNSYMRSPIGIIQRLAHFSLYLNAGLAIVNMLPAFPLDGGRIAYMMIAQKYDRRTATFVVGLTGTCFAVTAKLLFVGSLFAGFPIWSPPPFLPNWDALKLAWKGQTVRI